MLVVFFDTTNLCWRFVYPYSDKVLVFNRVQTVQYVLYFATRDLIYIAPSGDKPAKII